MAGDARAAPDLLFSFFMFTADLRPGDEAYARTIVSHMRALLGMGYAGFDLPIAPTNDITDTQRRYEVLRRTIDAAHLGRLRLTTNVAATREYDPSSADPAVRKTALDYLISRVDITAALGAEIMAGPIVLPYALFPRTGAGEALWSDALQDWARTRYVAAQPVLEKLAAHAERRHVRIAIEPVDHWETAGPNLVGEVLDICAGLGSRRIGVCIDSAHVMLGSDGPALFTTQAARAIADERLHYVHLSAPDRGAVTDSWIDWRRFMTPLRDGYAGPYLVEVFNAIPVFLDGLRLTRRKFWIPGEDTPEPGRPSAHDVARDAIATVRAEMERLP